jgi:hypothetical protein
VQAKAILANIALFVGFGAASMTARHLASFTTQGLWISKAGQGIVRVAFQRWYALELTQASRLCTNVLASCWTSDLVRTFFDMGVA